MHLFRAGVAGGAASGKTSVCDMIIEKLGDQRVVLVNQVNLYPEICYVMLFYFYFFKINHNIALEHVNSTTLQILTNSEYF